MKLEMMGVLSGFFKTLLLNKTAKASRFCRRRLGLPSFTIENRCLKLLEQSAVVEAPGLCYRNIPSVVTTAVGQMAVSKGRQGREAQIILKVYPANIHLKEVGTDVLVTAYEPILINPLSKSASTVGAGLAIHAMQSGFMPMVEVFKLAVKNFKVNDWGLFSPTV
ncbi:hypothetical protein CRYUN_Cryun21dG0008400 [Craigia yunnanensis]